MVDATGSFPPCVPFQCIVWVEMDSVERDRRCFKKFVALSLAVALVSVVLAWFGSPCRTSPYNKSICSALCQLPAKETLYKMLWSCYNVIWKLNKKREKHLQNAFPLRYSLLILISTRWCYYTVFLNFVKSILFSSDYLFSVCGMSVVVSLGFIGKCIDRLFLMVLAADRRKKRAATTWLAVNQVVVARCGGSLIRPGRALVLQGVQYCEVTWRGGRAFSPF